MKEIDTVYISFIKVPRTFFEKYKTILMRADSLFYPSMIPNYVISRPDGDEDSCDVKLRKQFDREFKKYKKRSRR